MSLEFTPSRTWSVIAIAAAAAVFATSVSAESIRLVRPSQAESLKNGEVSMTVYYLDHSSPLEVVATFGERGSVKPASQLRMSLADGDEIEFYIPGRPDVSFQFVRSGSVIAVHSNPADMGSLATN